MIQQVLSEAEWQNQLTEADLRALTPLIFGHINPYGTFNLGYGKDKGKNSHFGLTNFSPRKVNTKYRSLDRKN
jgi:hypothetical protein